MFIGLDLGTSGIRALLVDDEGRTHGTASVSYETLHAQPGWSEQNPRDWADACAEAVGKIRTSAPKAFCALKAIGVSGQMHGATLLGRDGGVLRPCMLWNDTRSAKQAARLDGDPAFRARSGNIVFPGFTAPKLVWLREHEPEIFARVAQVLLPKDYLNFWLSGTRASDMSDAAGTAWLDVGDRCWSTELLEKSGMRPGQVPPVYEGSAPIGTLRADLAADWGVSRDVVIAAGGGDNAVAACGIGAISEGDGFVSLGTSGVLLVARDSFRPRPETAVHTFCHAIPARWYQMGVILAATDSLNWLARITGKTPQELTAELGGTIYPPGGIRFLPYLSGERTPHDDAAIRGAFTGLDIAHGRAELTRAVLEGVAFALRDSLLALRETGAGIDRLLAIGGGAKSEYWVELLATILGVPLDLPTAGELGAALGAARLAQCAATGASPGAIMFKPSTKGTIEPNTELQDAFDAEHEKFRASYSKIRAIQ